MDDDDANDKRPVRNLARRLLTVPPVTLQDSDRTDTESGVDGGGNDSKRADPPRVVMKLALPAYRIPKLVPGRVTNLSDAAVPSRRAFNSEHFSATFNPSAAQNRAPDSPLAAPQPPQPPVAAAALAASPPPPQSPPQQSAAAAAAVALSARDSALRTSRPSSSARASNSRPSTAATPFTRPLSSHSRAGVASPHHPPLSATQPLPQHHHSPHHRPTASLSHAYHPAPVSTAAVQSRVHSLLESSRRDRQSHTVGLNLSSAYTATRQKTPAGSGDKHARAAERRRLHDLAVAARGVAHLEPALAAELLSAAASPRQRRQLTTAPAPAIAIGGSVVAGLAASQPSAYMENAHLPPSKLLPTPYIPNSALTTLYTSGGRGVISPFDPATVRPPSSALVVIPIPDASQKPKHFFYNKLRALHPSRGDESKTPLPPPPRTLLPPGALTSPRQRATAAANAAPENDTELGDIWATHTAAAAGAGSPQRKKIFMLMTEQEMREQREKQIRRTAKASNAATAAVASLQSSAPANIYSPPVFMYRQLKKELASAPDPADATATAAPAVDHSPEAVALRHRKREEARAERKRLRALEKAERRAAARAAQDAAKAAAAAAEAETKRQNDEREQLKAAALAADTSSPVRGRTGSLTSELTAEEQKALEWQRQNSLFSPQSQTQSQPGGTATAGGTFARSPLASAGLRSPRSGGEGDTNSDAGSDVASVTPSVTPSLTGSLFGSPNGGRRRPDAAAKAAHQRRRLAREAAAREKKEAADAQKRADAEREQQKRDERAKLKAEYASKARDRQAVEQLKKAEDDAVRSAWEAEMERKRADQAARDEEKRLQRVAEREEQAKLEREGAELKRRIDEEQKRIDEKEAAEKAKRDHEEADKLKATLAERAKLRKLVAAATAAGTVSGVGIIGSPPLGSESVSASVSVDGGGEERAAIKERELLSQKLVLAAKNEEKIRKAKERRQMVEERKARELESLAQRLAEKKLRASERREKLRTDADAAARQNSEDAAARQIAASKRVAAEQAEEAETMRLLIWEKELKAKERQLALKREAEETNRAKSTAKDSQLEEARIKAEAEYEREAAELRRQITERERKVSARQSELQRQRDEAAAEPAAAAAVGEADAELEDAETRELNRMIAEREQRRAEAEANRKKKRAKLLALNPRLTEDQLSALIALDDDETEPGFMSPPPTGTAAASAAGKTGSPAPVDESPGAVAKRAARKKTADALEMQLMKRLGLGPKGAPVTPTAAAAAAAAAGAAAMTSPPAVAVSPTKSAVPVHRRVNSTISSNTRSLLEKSVSQRFGLNSPQVVGGTKPRPSVTVPRSVTTVSSASVSANPEKRRTLEAVERGLRQRFGLGPTSPPPVAGGAVGAPAPADGAASATAAAAAAPSPKTVPRSVASPSSERRATMDKLEKQLMKRLGLPAMPPTPTAAAAVTNSSQPAAQPSAAAADATTPPVPPPALQSDQSVPVAPPP